MLIRRLELTNIKSYDYAEIFFSPGVNLIAGENGAGKTTLIESLGLSLFGYSPEKKLNSYFIRQGEKKGVITVDFTDNAGETYRVVRKLSPTGASWHAYDMQNNELDLHTAADMEAWMRERIGAEPDVNLPKLFGDIVGISQGAFTAPFLVAPRERTRLFNAILGVDSFEEASRKGRDTTSLLLSRISQLQLQLKEYEASEKQLAALREKSTALEREIRLLNTRHADFSAEFGRQTQEKKRLSAQKEELTRLSLQLRESEARGEALRKEILLLQEQRRVAEEAAKVLSQSGAGYESYQHLERQQQEQEKKRQALAALQSRLSLLQNEYAAAFAALEAGDAALAKDLERETARAAQKSEEAEALSAGLMEADRDIARQQQAHAALAQEKAALGEETALLQNRDSLLTRLQTGYEGLLALEETIERQKQKLSSKEELNALAALLPEREAETRRLNSSLSALTQRVKTLQQDAEKSKDGQCPILNTPCPNVTGSLSDFLLQKACALQNQIARETQQAQKAQAVLEQSRNAKDTLMSLLPVEEALLQNLEEQKKYFRGFSRYISQWTSQKKETPPAKEAQSAAQWQQTLLLLQEQQQAAKDTQNERLAALEQSSAASISALSQLEEQKKNLQAKINAARKDIDAANLSILSIRQAMDAQLQKRKEQAQQKSAIESLQLQLAAYDTLEQQIKTTREQMQQLRPQYEAYIQKSAEAARLSEIQAEISLRETAEQERLSLHALIAGKLKAAGTFDEAAFDALLGRMEQTVSQMAQVKGALDVKQKDLAALLEEIQDLEEIVQEAAQLEREYAQTQRAADLSRLLFDSILRHAGEKVASLYRSRISKDAAQLYREVSMENVELRWSADYDVVLTDVVRGKERSRSFRQLSGGEQMTAALSVRLGLLNRFSSAGIAFFDEPTSNLDARRRENLAAVIPAVTSRFQQVFVISHDDAFDSITDNILRLIKAPDATRLDN